MTAIQRIEQAISNGMYPEPVQRFRLYAITTSERHLKAGSDFRLIASAESRSSIEDMRDDFINVKFDVAVIIDGETSD